MPVSTECAAALLSFRYPSLTIKQSRMYTMPEKQTGCGMVSKCAWSCFLSVCKSPTLSLAFHQTDVLTTFWFASVHFILFLC